MFKIELKQSSLVKYIFYSSNNSHVAETRTLKNINCLIHGQILA